MHYKDTFRFTGENNKEDKEMKEMNITRLLKLYKQHYLKSYGEMAEKEYSCWGYFDCMEVDQVKNRAERGLLMNNKNGDMTDLWYASANATEELSGHYGQQSIGLFRYEADTETIVKDQEFWEEEKKGIILIASMIQLTDHSNVSQIMTEIEQTIFDSEYRDMGICGITYRTLDNFDLILFLKGNSYVVMSKLIDEVGKRKDVRYKYSVCGIAQKYLDQVSDQSKIDDIEYNGNKLVNDDIAEVWLEIVSNGKADLNNLSADFGDRAKYARVLGYMDNTICIRNTNMWKVVRLFRGGDAGITHKNKEFGNAIYNISTVILPTWTEIGCENRTVSQLNSEKINGWCMKKIEILKQRRGVFEDDKNEVLYSNWLALIRVLNVLSQYENSLFSKDIFRIIFPSMKLICDKFEDILDHYDADNFMKQGYDSVLIIERYINEVDGMIQHLIHTSQTFMAVPGYSGSLYDIPTKMLLFYMAYAYKLIEAFDDSEQHIGCFICPLLNSKPEVQEIETKGANEILLDIRLAQRHLYMPRAFVVILSHELYHYIVQECRSRKERATHLIKICAYALAYRLLHVKEDVGLNIEKFSEPIAAKEKEIQEFLVKTIPDVFKENNKESIEKAYLSATLSKLMTDSCYAVISDSQYGVDETLRRIQMQDWQKEEELKETLLQWSAFLRRVEQNGKRVLTKDTIEEIVDRFIYSFQEIYADLSSIICLELELKYYFEAILVSEGMMLDKDFDSILVINRLAVVVHTLSETQKFWETQWKELVKDETSMLKNLIAKIKKYIDQMTSKNQQNPRQTEGSLESGWQKGEIHEWTYYYLDGVWYEQTEYAKTCISKLQKHFSDTDEKKQCIKEIRDTFEFFKMHDVKGNKSYNDLFSNYDRLIENYNRAIDERINNESE